MYFLLLMDVAMILESLGYTKIDGSEKYCGGSMYWYCNKITSVQFTNGTQTVFVQYGNGYEDRQPVGSIQPATMYSVVLEQVNKVDFPDKDPHPKTTQVWRGLSNDE